MGYRISMDGIKPDERNVNKIKEALRPTNLTEVRRFLGMAQYYRHFIQNFSTIARPLYNLSKKNTQFK